VPHSTTHIDYKDVAQASERIRGAVRPLTLAPADPGAIGNATVWLAMEFMQHTGSFKARGALNQAAAHIDAHTMPTAGLVIASGGNAGLACAWAAGRYGIPATVFLPETAPLVKIERLRAYGATVKLVGTEYQHAAEAADTHATKTGALQSHAYDNPYIAAGAGTLLEEIYDHPTGPLVDTIVVAVGGGGLFSGVAAAAAHHGVRVIAAEPENCRALNAAIEAGQVVDVDVNSVAADSLGARRTSRMALHAAQAGDVRSVLVTDEQIIQARRALWDHRRLAVEHGAATALAALTSGAYTPTDTETVAVVLCGANTHTTTLT
jgi:threonine dehydratase